MDTHLSTHTYIRTRESAYKHKYVLASVLPNRAREVFHKLEQATLMLYHKHCKAV